MANSQKKRRDRLFKRRPYCFFCGVQLTHPKTINRGAGTTKSNYDNMATIEHLDSNLSPLRGAFSGVARTVLCCYKCNQERNEVEMEEIGVTAWRAMSAAGALE